MVRAIQMGQATLRMLVMLTLLVSQTTVLASLTLADTFVSPTTPQATPEELGLRLPDVPPLPGRDRRVLVATDGEPLVAKVYLQVDDHWVVLMPDGRLLAVPCSEAPETERPFAPFDKRQLAQRMTDQRFAGFRTRITRHYVCVYNTSEPFVQGTSRILESMYPAVLNYFDRLKIEVDDPDYPLVVVMFRTQAEFQKYRNVAPSLVAYYNTLSNHIVLYEQSELTRIAPELAFKQAVSTIAHEGVHQILHNIGVQQRLSHWPLWFSEGLAEYFAPTELNRRVRWKGIGFVNDLRLHELNEFYKHRDRQLTGGQLIRGAVKSNKLRSLDYATSWSLIHYLSKYRRDAFRDYLQDVTKLEPLQRIPAGSLFAKHFGQDYAAMERELVKYLQSLPYVDPIVNQTHFVIMVKGSSRRKALVTSSPVELRKYHQEEAARKRRPFRIKAFSNRIAAEHFAAAWLKGG